MERPRVGVLGSGDVGRVLGAGLAALGHSVKLGSREPRSDKMLAWVDQVGARASTGNFAETAEFGELILLATLWSGTQAALELAGQNFKGKVVIDVTNPLDFSKGMPPRLALGHTDSGGEQVQRWLPGARVVKAFNTIGNASMVHPKFPGGPPDMYFCGDDPTAREKVKEIIEELGLNPIDLGGLEGARYLEPLCILWVRSGIALGDWNIAFKLLRK